MLCTAFGAPARADEKASLENALLVEQLVDVATTQHLLRTTTCGQPTAVVNAAHRPIGSTRYCVTGMEADPLARPFVGSAAVNVGAALAVNGLVRLASRATPPQSARWLRLAVAIYPAVIIGTVAATVSAGRFTPGVSFSVRRRL